MRSLSPGWMRGLLLASLCLNVLLGAFMVTRWLEGMRLPYLMAGPPQLIERVARRRPLPMPISCGARSGRENAS